MLKTGDCVIFIPDGSRGVVVRIESGRVYVIWEDYFTSCEKENLLLFDPLLTLQQSLLTIMEKENKTHVES